MGVSGYALLVRPPLFAFQRGQEPGPAGPDVSINVLHRLAAARAKRASREGQQPTRPA